MGPARASQKKHGLAITAGDPLQSRSIQKEAPNPRRKTILDHIKTIKDPLVMGFCSLKDKIFPPKWRFLEETVFNCPRLFVLLATPATAT
jgi:hypothetical protein